MELIDKALKRKKAETEAEQAAQNNQATEQPAFDAAAANETLDREVGVSEVAAKSGVKGGSRKVAPKPALWTKNRLVGYSPQDKRVSSYDKLRTQVLQRMNANNWTKLAVTSPTPNCGKTLTSINLAISMAKQPETTVLLVDFDLRRPTIAKYLGIERGPGLTDYFAGDCGLEDVFVNPGIEGLVCLANWEPSYMSSEILSGNRAHALAEELGNRYAGRKILFDLPPVLASDDAMAFLPAIDSVLFVAASSESTVNHVKSCEDFLANANVVAGVFNKSRELVKDYSYGYD